MASHLNSNMSCGLKVETTDPEWHRTLTKVLKRIKGVSYAIDVEQGMAYVRGRVDPNKLLKKLSKGGKHADICWVETGNMNPYMNNGYQYPPPGAGYPQPGPGYHPGYHPGYAMASYYPKRPPLYSGYGYGYDPRGYEFPTWA
ncbi:METAL ION-BINDING PROTEIN [Salix koriyanagi]|uniref:METAL ION-BINDING PROTEIN n=1 Tax=Salix koriyanagi TaxID=2511006 RepID=A0A9Q0QL10_9ROSI|nr:METAL ION-BINDING PROTEIN [Salix koriyanagi]